MSYEPMRPPAIAEELNEFLGNFRGYIDRLKEQKLREIGDPGKFEDIAERAEFEASIEAAQNWLVERWGPHYPCPVCQNVEWTVSIVLPTLRPVGFLGFHVTCAFCGNTMQVVPGKAFLSAPIRVDPQLRLSEDDQ